MSSLICLNKLIVGEAVRLNFDIFILEIKDITGMLCTYIWNKRLIVLGKLSDLERNVYQGSFMEQQDK